MSVCDGGRSPALNPVASGDNLWTKVLPPLVPCCEGKELQIDDECIASGLSMISVREAVRILACSSDTTSPTLKHRNSFRCVHRPELRSVPGLRHLSPADLRLMFLEIARLPYPPSPSCPPASTESRSELRATSARELPAGMRLHRAHMFTAVLAAADPARACATDCRRTSDDAQDLNEADDITQDDETLANEEVQIILRPKIDEEPADCSTR